MFGTPKNQIDHAALCARLVRNGYTRDLFEALRAKAISADEYAWLKKQERHCQPSYTMPLVTRANLVHEPTPWLKLWQSIRTSRAAAPEPAPTPGGERWFSANRTGS